MPLTDDEKAFFDSAVMNLIPYCTSPYLRTEAGKSLNYEQIAGVAIDIASHLLVKRAEYFAEQEIEEAASGLDEAKCPENDAA